ncbi:hypothetical protein DE146DRAFT_679043 [Phaeosphaeria sp. MPI-PUGE-AT-0046c]|nr:hypothetical protein DE146DRAFT_679043 [Phaeosphaeria sp. MPI-PUGE-AT-0046c]
MHPRPPEMSQVSSLIIVLVPELYERLFIRPKTRSLGSLRCTCGDPTSIRALGFSRIVGWQGSGGLAVPTSGSTIWFNGILRFLAGIGEFLLGENFPMIVFLSYGAHLMAYATTFVPFFQTIGVFNPEGSGHGSPGAKTQSSVFLASLAFYLIAMCILSFIILLGSLRVNGVFVFFFLLVLGYFLFLALIIAIMELYIPDLPVSDLSTVTKPKSRAGLKQE